MYELKPTKNGQYYFEALGFKSLPFEIKDARKNREWFSLTIHSKVEGTVQ